MTKSVDTATSRPTAYNQSSHLRRCSLRENLRPSSESIENKLVSNSACRIWEKNKPREKKKENQKKQEAKRAQGRKNKKLRWKDSREAGQDENNPLNASISPLGSDDSCMASVEEVEGVGAQEEKGERSSRRRTWGSRTRVLQAPSILLH